MRQPFLILLSILFYTYSGIAQSDISDKLKKEIPGLPKVAAKEVGISQDTINKLIELINTNPPNDFRGMVVIKDSKLVVEEYFNTYWRATIHDIRSSTKSITALLLGIAIDKGLVEDVEQSIYDFFPEDKFPPPPSEKHLTIKIKHLLTMSPGLDADTYNINSEGHAINWVADDDWLSYLLSLPMNAEPGTEWAYADASALLIGAIIEEASGMTLSAFAEENLFTPLGIKEYYWFKSPQNRTSAMGNLYISTLDFAKIGLLVLNKGSWGEKQIVSDLWVNEMSKKRFDISDTNPFANDYGYLWYMSDKEVDGDKYNYFFASGNGGNVLIVVPSENMVVSLTSSAYGQGYGHNRTDNIFGFILKSLVEK